MVGHIGRGGAGTERQYTRRLCASQAPPVQCALLLLVGVMRAKKMMLLMKRNSEVDDVVAVLKNNRV